MNLDFGKYADDLVPAIVQDEESGRVLMLGFMNADALEKTKETGRVTFYSRSHQRLWTKGETSGNYLELASIAADCDHDTILIKARPAGPVCHTGADTCFGETNDPIAPTFHFLQTLETVIQDRRIDPTPSSYVSSLFEEGLNKIAQKVGEEAIETVIAAKDEDAGVFINEAADLLFHYLILLNEKGLSFNDILNELGKRHR